MAVAAGTANAGPVSVTKTVDSQAGPWDISVNPTFDYGVHDNGGPTIVSAADGFDFSAGNQLARVATAASRKRANANVAVS